MPRRLRSLLLVLGTGMLLVPTATAWLDAAREVSGQRYSFAQAGRRVFVLGFDGVDPDILKEFMVELPTVAALARQGTLSDCRTTNPPESPVAWATFATGLNPGDHGIYDFLRRDPKGPHPYRPLNGMVAKRLPEFGPLGIPVRPPGARNLRGGRGFWEPVADAGYRVSVLRMPLTFPPVPARGGEVLCGLGVPDLRGTVSSYTVFEAGRDVSPGYTIFGGLRVKIYPRGGRATAELDGPPDPRAPRSGRRMSVPIEFKFAGDGAVVTVGDEPPVALQTGLFSNWVRVRFKAGPFVRLDGLVRFVLLHGGDTPAVYASPIQIAPGSAPIPISAPASFASLIRDRLGPMKTMGWPEDTFAANERVLSDVLMFEDVRGTYLNQERLLLDRIDHANADLVSMVFTAQDRISHLFFRWRDRQHPAYDEKARKVFAQRTGIHDPILESYRWMDRTLAKVTERMKPGDVLIAVSDHGFHSWRMGINLNTWLAREGYLVRAGEGVDSAKSVEDLFRDRSPTAHIDWSRTRAYGLGLGQIYLNLKGREADGVVEPAEREALLEEIRSKLMTLEDEQGQPVFTRIYRSEKIWKGSRFDEAPDLQCAFATGFRVSWQTALLGVPPEVFEVNDYPWSGDHCSNDVTETAGFFLSNRRLKDGVSPGLENIAPTVCRLFGVDPPPGATAPPLRFD
ncbi:MAG: alkaline phosphatase family protein [Planctomycetota bacterium]|nr:alkaline phosphatase family protein [Planctomycetota bacterium]